MTHVDHGFDLVCIQRDLDKAEWEINSENSGNDIRRVWLGTVIGLTPSHKFYTCFANRNVSRCQNCKGMGSMPPHNRRRITKRINSRVHRIRKIFDARTKINEDSARKWLKTHWAWRAPYQNTCTACAGMGSREAHLDELWTAAAEKAISALSTENRRIFFSWEDGDGFAIEIRDHECGLD